METVQVFISHTSDIAGFPAGRPFVQAALDAVGRAGMAPVDMRYFAARDGRPVDYCRERVRGCEIYVAVIGFRYGSLPPGESLSYTEVEFEEATAAGMPRLVFLLEEPAGLAPGMVDEDRGLVDGFRQRLRDAGLVVRGFNSADGLELEIFHALSELTARRRPRSAPRPETTATGVTSPRRAPRTGLASAARGLGRSLTAAPLGLFTDREKVLRDVPGYGRRVEDSTDRITLRIHPAIPLPGNASPGLSDEFPLYVPRDVDRAVRTWIRRRARSGGGLVVLVGPAAAGKTRTMSEALLAELPDWQLLRPTSPQVNALVQSGADLSRSVLWLNELQTFFVGEPLRPVAVESLLAGEHGPVILAATIRGEERDRLLSKNASPGKEMNANAIAILRMLARWSGRAGGTERAVWLDLPDRLTSAEQEHAVRLAARDPRLALALRDARDGDVTATLACETELIGRWRGDGDRDGQALVTAAVIARRCGHIEPVPETVIAEVALAYLSGQGAAPGDREWLPAALSWAQLPILDSGEIAALRPVRTTPGVVDGYLVSDILVQDSEDSNYPDLTRLLDDEEIWRTVLRHAAPEAVAEIALSAYNDEKLAVAEEAWRKIADLGDPAAARRLGLLYWEQDRNADAESWMRRAADVGSSTAMTSLGDWLWGRGQSSAAQQLLIRAAEAKNVVAMQRLGMHLGAQGDYQAAEKWTRRSAMLGNVVAMADLGYLLASRGDYAEAEEWGLKAAELGFPGAMDNLGDLYQKTGDFDSAMAWYRRGAERAYAGFRENPRNFRPWPGEAGDQGTAESMLKFASFLRQLGQAAEARTWYERGAGIGDARAAAALAADCHERGDEAGAADWRATAAQLALANLSRNEASIRVAYGKAAVLRHTAIMAAYADDLAQQGNAAEAERWHRRAASFGGAPGISPAARAPTGSGAVAAGGPSLAPGEQRPAQPGGPPP